MIQKLQSTKPLTLAVTGLMIIVGSASLVVYMKSDNDALKKAQQNLQAPQAGQATEQNSGIGVNDPKSYADYKKPNESELRRQLSPVQYDVTQQDGTEKPFNNPLWDSKAEGIYVDILSGEPLYSSVDKYDSGTGWPSFTQPLNPDNIVLKVDGGLGVERTETRSKYGDNHLGHVFDDGPTTLEASGGAKPTGLRYCMNSAALEFISKSEMTKRGYGVYLPIFNS